MTSRSAALLAVLGGVLAARGAWAAGEAHGQSSSQAQSQAPAQSAAKAQTPAKAQPATCPPESAKPVLSVGDFNGDTVVDGKDIQELRERIARSDNAALFDMNADSRVNDEDLQVVMRQAGARSSPQDQELAAVFRATERYRDIANAIADDYIPVTESFRGHGVHWAQRNAQPGVFQMTRPQGLNYSEDGRLLAVFYSFVLDNTDLADLPPAGFTGDEMWHSHTDLCFHGVNLKSPTYDWRDIMIDLCVPRDQCDASVWVGKLYMIHAWLYESNPCGVFGGENPRITQGSTGEQAIAKCPPGAEHGGAEPPPPPPSGGAPHTHTH